MNQEAMLLITFIPIVLLIAVIGYILPFYLKNEILFGVRLSDIEYRSLSGDQIKQQYKQSYIIFTVVFVFIAIRLLYSFPLENMAGFMVGFQILLLYSILVVYNRKVLSMKNNLQLAEEEYEEWIVVDTETRTKPKMISILWFLPSLLLVLAHFIFAYLKMSDLPDSIPLSFDMSGNVIAYTEKTMGSIFRMPFVSLFLLMVLLAIYFVIKSSKQQLNVQSPEKSKIQNILFRQRWMLFFTIFTPLMIIYNIFLSLSYLLLIDIKGVIFLIIAVFFPIVPIMGTLLLAIYTGQSGSRISVDIKEKRTKAIAIDDNKYWKLGLIYYNPNDPSIWLEKRMGIGWTINMGNPIAVGGFIVFLIVLFIYIRIFGVN